MQGKVSVGLSTVTGYGVSSAAFVGAVLAYLGGDHSNQTVAIIGLGIIGALAFAITNIGRQRQAVAITKQVLLPGPPGPAGVTGATGATGPQGVSAPGTKWLDLDGDGIEQEWKLGADDVWVPTGQSRPAHPAVSNAGAVVADPSLEADPTDVHGAGDLPIRFSPYIGVYLKRQHVFPPSS